MARGSSFASLYRLACDVGGEVALQAGERVQATDGGLPFPREINALCTCFALGVFARVKLTK